MIDPSISSLLEKVDNRFLLCVLVGKRARQVIGGEHKLTNCDSRSPVTIAVNELNENNLAYTITKKNMKKNSSK